MIRKTPMFEHAWMHHRRRWIDEVYSGVTDGLLEISPPIHSLVFITSEITPSIGTKRVRITTPPHFLHCRYNMADDTLRRRQLRTTTELNHRESPRYNHIEVRLKQRQTHKHLRIIILLSPYYLSSLNMVAPELLKQQ